MNEAPRYRKGDVIKIGLDSRICVAADEQTAVFCHCNRHGVAVRLHDILIIDPIHGRYSKPIQYIKHKDGKTLSMKLNQP